LLLLLLFFFFFCFFLLLASLLLFCEFHCADSSIVIGEYLYHQQDANANSQYTETLLAASPTDRTPHAMARALGRQTNYNALDDVLDEDEFYGRLYSEPPQEG
jgi:hypothetical protein